MKPKQLIWRDARATTPFGECRIGNLGRRWWFAIGDNDSSRFFRSRAEAQAAAQADFERRVRECFEENA